MQNKAQDPCEEAESFFNESPINSNLLSVDGNVNAFLIHSFSGSTVGIREWIHGLTNTYSVIQRVYNINKTLNKRDQCSHIKRKLINECCLVCRYLSS